MTWNYGSKGQFLVKWTILTKRRRHEHLFLCRVRKNGSQAHNFVYLKRYLTDSNCKNYLFFIKISSFEIVNTKFFPIFPFRATDGVTSLPSFFFRYQCCVYYNINIIQEYNSKHHHRSNTNFTGKKSPVTNNGCGNLTTTQH